MILGFNIFCEIAGNAPYRTNPFPRRGLSALFSIQTTHVSGTGNPTLNAIVQHKNREDTSWTTAGSFAAIMGAGLKTLDVSGLKEEIRFSFTFGGGSSGAFLRVFIPPPAWRPYT